MNDRNSGAFSLRVANIALPVGHAAQALRGATARRLGVNPDTLDTLTVARRSIDARNKSQIQFIYTVDVTLRGTLPESLLRREDVQETPCADYGFQPGPRAAETPRPVVAGAGPCGLFAALMLAEWGLRPLLIERGKPVRERAQDVAAFWASGRLNPKSNALFGEGGAGTFSDGKLTTQIKDPGNRCRKVLQELVRAGAPEEILFVQKPHIGTDNLPAVVENVRNRILELGGEVWFDCQLTDLFVEDGAVRGAIFHNGSTVRTDAVVLAIGHSARDTFEMLERRAAKMEAKSFSVGVRIEHLQKAVDCAQYGKCAGHPQLGAAEYKLVHHAKCGRSVYTFCMCPGGHVIAASSEPGHLVTNGMSAYHRDAPNANSGLLVGVSPADYGSNAPLAGVAFQRRWEQLAFELGGGTFHAPAQLVADFLAGRASTGFGGVEPSYRPGVIPADLAGCLPDYAVAAMREAIPALGRKMRGFDRPDAVLTGVETRSSSPVRILRGDDGQNPALRGLFPAGEGAGYAGGIMSAAADGIRIAERVALALAVTP